MKRVLLLVGVLSLIAAGCSDSATDTTRPQRPSTTTSTRPAQGGSSTTSSTLPPTSTTTTAPGTTTSTTSGSGGDFALDGEPGLFPPDAIDGSGGASGSGCVTGGSATLPDGVWFGYVVAEDGSSLTFDLACFYFGAIAEEEGDKDGVEVFNGYYVRNQNPRTFEVDYSPDGVMWWLGHDSTGNFTLYEVAIASWPTTDEVWPCPGDLCGVWLYVNDGQITEAYEQYVP